MGGHWSRQRRNLRKRPEHVPTIQPFETPKQPSPVEHEPAREPVDVFPNAETEPNVAEPSDRRQGEACGEPDSAELHPPPPQPVPDRTESMKQGPPNPLPLHWDPLRRRSPRPYSSSSGPARPPTQENTGPEAAAVKKAEDAKVGPEHQPIPLGMAVPSIEIVPEPETAPGPEPQGVPDHLVSNPPQGGAEQFLSPSTFISSLHVGDSSQAGAMSSGPEPGPEGHGTS